LRRLLEAGATHARAFAGRRRRPDASVPADGQEQPTKRFRSGDVYALVAEKGIRTSLELQALAQSLSAQGDSSLAQFCTTCGEKKLSDLVEAALAVIQAPQTLALRASSRMDLLRKAAREKLCACEGIWSVGAEKVLQNNGEDVQQFCRDVCRALELGACRGVNMAIVGLPGCGKSMLFESLDLIYEVMGKPQRGSTFPLSNVPKSHVLVWQEYKHHDGTILFEDLLSLAVGEKIDIRMPHAENLSHRDTAPMFYTC